MEAGTEPAAAEIGQGFIGFVDALLPGDCVFPSASSVGAHGVLAMRLRDTVGANALAALEQVLAGGPDGEAPEAAAARIEREHPALFEAVQVTLYYAYYETPAVIAAIRSLGITYNDAPQPKGYRMRPFDPALDLPAQPRGAFVATEAVSRVDLSQIDFLIGEPGPVR